MKFFFGLLAFLDLDARSNPLDHNSINVTSWHLAMEHPTIGPISSPYSYGCFEALSCSDRLSPPLHKTIGIFRVNPGNPFPSQQTLRRLPNEIQPGLIEEIEVTIRPCGVDHRRSRVDDLAKIQVLIVHGSILGCSHGADGTPRRIQL
ncbi:hypothetical protein RBB82_19950 [Tunturiibacter lichenicola]